MTAKKINDIKMVDIRAVDRNIDKGYLNQGNYDSYLKSLPDSADKSEPFEVEQDQVIIERAEKREQFEEIRARYEESQAAKSSNEETDQNEEQG